MPLLICGSDPTRHDGAPSDALSPPFITLPCQFYLPRADTMCRASKWSASVPRSRSRQGCCASGIDATPPEDMLRPVQPAYATLCADRLKSWSAANAPWPIRGVGAAVTVSKRILRLGNFIVLFTKLIK